MRIFRKTAALILAAALLLTAYPVQAESESKAELVLHQEGADAFLELVLDQSVGPVYRQEGYAHLSVTSPESPVIATPHEEFAAMTFYTLRLQEMNGVGFTVDRAFSILYMPWGEFVTEPDQPLNNQYIPAYGSIIHTMGCPRQAKYRYEIFVVTGTDDNGHRLEFYGLVEHLNFTADEYQGASGSAKLARDTHNLRHGADFQVNVADGVWWVPAVSLGESRYTNGEIAKAVADAPEEKQQMLSTLYEALQMYQISNFAEESDNQRIWENGVDWEHHKPGYHAVRTNRGCCATSSNWLNYILKDDYEEVGFISFSQKNGGGHVFNYIKHEGFYYFVDLTHYRTDFQYSSAPETGFLTDYQRSDRGAGNLHKASSPEAYAEYYRAISNDPAELFYLYTAGDCLPLDGVPTENGLCITLANTADITVIYDDPVDSLTYAFVDPPLQKPDWALIPDAVFQVDPQYRSAENSLPDTAFYQPGDVLTLEDKGREAVISVIDGKEYTSAHINSLFFVEANLPLNGGCRKSYHQYDLNVKRHSRQLENMESLCLAEITMDTLGPVQNPRLAICREEKGGLIVEEVFFGRHYFGTFSMSKNKYGRWSAEGPMWYLLEYEKDEETYREFGRIGLKVIN